MYSIDINLLAQSLGTLSLIGSGFAFFPAIANNIEFIQKRKSTWWQISRIALIITVFLGLVHGLLMTQKADIDFYNLNTYWVYAEGLLVFNLLIFLAFIFSEIKYNFKKLVYLTYAALFLLGCHIWQYSLHLFG
ncbi:hypothetical protein [Myxosarcina sp. GI1]|uniref:hypothetical protein n=1 Tax=Myxosarcina sp. GI1 TaxID=1541065 RepID=UPI00068D95DA|nr:hypothetical protein [Myxosarcina sp. GI1]